MRLNIDTTGKTFTVAKPAAEKVDQNGKQKFDRETQAPLWVVQVVALDDMGADVLQVTLAGQMPKVTQGMVVTPVELEAIPWATNGRNGVAYRAKQLNPAAGSKAA